MKNEDTKIYKVTSQLQRAKQMETWYLYVSVWLKIPVDSDGFPPWKLRASHKLQQMAIARFLSKDGIWMYLIPSQPMIQLDHFIKKCHL